MSLPSATNRMKLSCRSTDIAKPSYLRLCMKVMALPILEAMSQGAPIIASEIPATIELSREHSNQVLLFELGSQEQQLSQLGLVDRNCDKIRSKLQYGSLDIYRYDSVAKRHVEVYDRV